MGKDLITPISPSKCLIKNEMRVFTYNELSIPTYGFDKPFYAVYDGTLCEVLIESIDYYPSYGLSMWNLSLATKDGVVRKSVSSTYLGHIRPFSAFSSVEDFENNNPIVHHSRENTFKYYTSFANIIAANNCNVDAFELGDDGNLYQYVWDAKRLMASRVLAKVPTVIRYDRNNGLHFVGDSYDMGGRYKSKTDAIMDNKITVVSFNQSRRPREITKTLNFSVEVKGKDIDEIEDKRKAILMALQKVGSMV